jgi:hypothetical protein
VDRLPLTALCASALGGATAFFCIAMPSPLFESLVLASGLPDLLPAAEPPLGTTARLLFAGVAGLGAALLTALLLVILGAPERRAPARPRFVPPERSETYPESWPRRPLSMEKDIGAPAPEPVSHVAEAEWQEIETGVAEFDPAPPPPPEPVQPSMRERRQEDGEDPISLLMERLDAAVARKMRLAEVDEVRAPAGGSALPLDEDHIRATLAELQRLASRGR